MAAKKKEKIKKDKREIPEKKKKFLEEIVQLIKKHNTVMIGLIENLPSTQFQKLKKNLSGKASIRVIKKTIMLLALEKARESKKGIELLEKSLESNFAVLFSDKDPFELAAILSENKTNSYAKPGYVAKEDLIVEAGPTDLPAGPAISELSKAGIKASIESGKIIIKERSIVVKKGEKVNENVANALMKLEITPIVISVRPIIAYDSKVQKVYENIKVDKEETLAMIGESSTKAFNFALNIDYIAKETIKFLLMKASVHFNSLQNKIPETKEELKEEKQEEQKEEKDNAQTEEKDKNENINQEENKQ